MDGGTASHNGAESASGWHFDVCGGQLRLKERIEHGTGALAQAAGGVSALEQENLTPVAQIVGQSAGDRGHIAKSGAGDFHRGQRVVDVGVETARHQYDFGAECKRGGHEESLQRAYVFCVATTRRQGDVEGGSNASTDSGLDGVSRSGVVRVLMGRNVQNRGILLEEVLSAVSVVNVPVEDQDPLDARLRTKSARGDGDVVEQAEAHGAVRFGVMSGWTNGGDSRLHFARSDETREVDGATSGEQRDVEALLRNIGVGVDVAGCPADGIGDDFEVFARVDAQNFLSRCRTRLDWPEVLLPKRESFVDRSEPLGSLGVSAGRPVLQEARILDDGDGSARVFVCGSHGRPAYPSAWRPASTSYIGARL